MRARILALSLGLAAVTVLAGCSGSSGGSSGDSGGAASPNAAAPGAGGSASDYYVSLGDSYAAGYQATGRNQGRTTNNGFADQIVAKAKAKGYDYTLANFGCGGATTDSMLTSPGCKTNQYAVGASYSATQLAAGVAFLKAHPGHVGLVTISIGGNDVIPCGLKTDVVGCLTSAIATMRTNLNSIATQVRAAAGPSVRIVGTTYPDFFLGNLLSTDKAAKSLATLSVSLFKSFVNPQLQQAYQAVGGSFVDVTAASGAYGPLTKTTKLAPFGTIPVPVADICMLTFYCELQDIHPRTNGYGLIAALVVGTLPKS